MKWIEILRKDKYALLQSESDTQYAIVSGYDPTQPENQQWSSGTYFTYWNDAKRKANCLQNALDCFRSRTEENYVTKGQKYLEIYREDYSEGTFNEILQSLDLDNDRVGDAFGCYCIQCTGNRVAGEAFRASWQDEDRESVGDQNEDRQKNYRQRTDRPCGLCSCYGTGKGRCFKPSDDVTDHSGLRLCHDVCFFKPGCWFPG